MIYLLIGLVLGIGLYFSIRGIALWLSTRKTAHWTQRVKIPRDIQEALDKNVSAGLNLNDTGSLVGKIIEMNGKKYLVIASNLVAFCRDVPELSDFDILLYRNGEIFRKRVDSKTNQDLYKKYCVQKPLRSREIRRDLRSFCNNQCILDCDSGCILRKYGKGNNTTK